MATLLWRNGYGKWVIRMNQINPLFLEEAEGVGVTPGGEFLAEPSKWGRREVGSDNGAGATLRDDFSLEIDDER